MESNLLESLSKSILDKLVKTKSKQCSIDKEMNDSLLTVLPIARATLRRYVILRRFFYDHSLSLSVSVSIIWCVEIYVNHTDVSKIRLCDFLENPRIIILGIMMYEPYT